MDFLKNKKVQFYLLYTFLFAVACIVILNYFYLNGLTFINYVDDGLFQHYQSQIYLGRYIRGIITELIHNHRLVIPQWDFTLGEGMDIMASLHSDAVGDPITALVTFFADENVYLFYDLSILLKIYLSGLFFSWLCFYSGKKNYYAILAGAMVYDFCYYSIINLTGHNYFYTPMMYLPLIILGVEKAINNDKPYALTVGVFLSAISQLYFFFMVVMLTVIYVVVRLLTLYGLDIRKIAEKVLKIFIYSLTGLLMAAIIVLPMIYVYTSDIRMGFKIENGALYDRFYYERLLSIFLSNDNAYDLCLGFASPVLLALFMAFRRPLKNKLLCILNIIALACICIPVLGKVLNGFRFVSSRWCFGISLLIAYTLVNEWDELKEDKYYQAFMLFGVFGIACVSAWSRVDRVLIPLCIALFFLFTATSGLNKKYKKIDLRQGLMLFLIMFNIFYIADYDLSYRGSEHIKNVMSKKEAVDLLTTSEAYQLKQYVDKNDDEVFFRYSGDYLTPNNAMLNGVKSTDYYFSITNPYDQLFRNDLNLTNRCSWMIKGYEGRSELENLANVRYYLTPHGYEKSLPYGFELAEEGNVDIYRNTMYLSFGYTYDKVMSVSEWQQLTALEKQKVMLQAVVVDEDTTINNVNYDVRRIPYSIISNDDITVEVDKITVNEAGASFSIVFEGLAECENYLTIEGIDFEDVYGVIEDDHTEAEFYIRTSAGRDKSIYYLTQSHHYYYGKQNYSVFLNYEKEALKQIDVEISLPGVYHISGLYVECLPLTNYPKYIGELSQDTLQNVKLDANRVSGEIDLDNDKYLLLSVPYSKGWKASVDGEVAELLQANEHYMALRLGSGHHEIELIYATPMLKYGALISLVSSLAFGVYVYMNRKKKNK